MIQNFKGFEGGELLKRQNEAQEQKLIHQSLNDFFLSGMQMAKIVRRRIKFGQVLISILQSLKKVIEYQLKAGNKSIVVFSKFGVIIYSVMR